MKLSKFIAIGIAGLSIAPIAARAATGTDTITLLFNYVDPNGPVTGDMTLTAAPLVGDPARSWPPRATWISRPLQRMEYQATINCSRTPALPIHSIAQPVNLFTTTL